MKIPQLISNIYVYYVYYATAAIPPPLPFHVSLFGVGLCVQALG